MRFDAAEGGAVPRLSGAEILAQVPGLADFADVAPVDFACLPGPHMTPALMFDLARLIERETGKADVHGVVVTHGTDTLEETAYMTDLLLRPEKPVVFVGALRNSSEMGWDGPANLRSATRVAAATATAGLGAVVVMGERIFAASDATKTDTESLHTFQSRDHGPLGFVDRDRVIVNLRKVAREQIQTDRLEERVEVVKLSAGSSGMLIRAALAGGMRGLILEGLGRGNVPVTCLDAVEEAAKNIPIVITSRCPRGRVLDTYAYAGAGRHLKKMGVILGGMLPSHKARIKLMLLLGAGADVDRIRNSFEA